MALTELEKVAVFFVAIGPERAEELLRRLGVDAMMQIAGAMRRLGPVSLEMKQAVLREMLELLKGRRRPERQRGTGETRSKGRGGAGGSQDDLLSRVSDLFEKDVDARNLNWEAAGLDFDASPPRPPDDEDDPRSRRRT